MLDLLPAHLATSQFEDRDSALRVWKQDLLPETPVPNSAVASPQQSNAVQVDTMAALFYRVTLCALALFPLEVKGRPLA